LRCELCSHPRSAVYRPRSSSDLGQNHPDLPSRVASPVREEAIVMAARAPGADRDVTDAEGAGPIREKRAQIHGDWGARILARQLAVHVRAHLIALPADRRTEMKAQPGSDEAPVREHGNALIQYACRGAPPSRVEQRRGAGWMREEYRDAIGDRDRRGSAALRCCVTVGVRHPQPSFPIARVHGDVGAVHLTSSGEAWSERAHFVDKRVPARHHLGHGLRPVRAVGSCRSRRRDGANAEGREVVDDLARRHSRHEAR
jgi:hypothetical protein